MRVIISIICAILGLGLVDGSHMLFGLLVGGCIGLGIAELASQRARLQELEKEISALRRMLVQRAWRDGEEPGRAALEGADSRWSAQPSAPSRASAEAGPAVRSVASRETVAPGAVDRPLAEGPGAATPVGTTPPPRQTASGYRAPSRPDAPGQSGDDIVESIGRLIREYFTGGNTVVRVGIIILFFGVAFLLRYVAEHSHVPIEFRLSGVAMGGIGLLALGWRLRLKRPGYGLALQGGAVGILYLTVFAGLRIYSVLAPGPAFALLVVLATFCVALAILQDSQSFALLAVTGGFLAPILASSGQGNHVVLFSYYVLLNAAILAVAWFRAWRLLNLAGFLFTFVIGAAWGALSYEPRLFASTEPFLILFFLFYVAIAILFASRQSPELRGYVDGTLVFGTPMAAFGLQSAMLHNRPFTLAYSALAVSAFYLLTATVLHRARQATQRLLVEAFMALGVLFLTLAVPLALDGRWSAATWAVEGAALVWIGCRQRRMLPRAFGSLLQIAGGVIFCFDINAPHSAIPILNSAYLGGVMVSAASVFCAVMLERTRGELTESERSIAPVLFFWGVLWWLFSGLTEIQRHAPDRYQASVGLLLMALTALISSELQRRARLSVARVPPIGLLPAMAAYAALAALEVHHPFADGGWLAWPLTFAVFYFVVRRHEGQPGGVLANFLHVGSAWLLTALLCWEVAWDINKAVAGGGSWPMIAWALVPAVALFAVLRLAQRPGWPVGPHRRAYLGIAGPGLAVYLATWSLLTNATLAGNPYPLPFLPLLNPLDLAELFVLLVLLRFAWYLRRERAFADLNPQIGPVFAVVTALAFVWLNAALLRTLHHWAGVAYQPDALLGSTLVQTSLSIFWTILALLTMLVATRAAARVAWIVGASLLGVVIAKLFLVDLSRAGTIERIVSFVGVGLLMLVIGYFSPLPPASGGEDTQEPTRARS